MATCTYCDSFFFFSGKKEETGNYCNEECQAAGHMMTVSMAFSPEEMEAMVQATHHGACPRCSGPGPVDIHKAHRIASFIMISSWPSESELSCRKCGRKRQASGFIRSGRFGWWSLHGIILTPIQLTKNIVGMIGGPKPGNPSELVRLDAGAKMLEAAAQQAKPEGLA
ncbi:MAG: hypothetical protein ACI8T1_004699 [Verrucomicrobiales bacterium]|jgi:hypothetical protein